MVNYDRGIEKLMTHYKSTIKEILYLLSTADLDTLDTSRRRILLKQLGKLLTTLDSNTESWVKKYIPKAYLEGEASVLVELGQASSIQEAVQLLSFSGMHKDFVEAMVADTFEDLLQATNNTRRKVKQTIQNIVAQQMRSKATQNLGRKTMTRDIINDLRKQLQDAGTFAIRDKANRRWSIETYSKMLVRTKLQQANIEGTRNKAAEEEVYYGIISSHNASDACRFHEGRIVKLVDSAEGDYPTIDQLKASKQIFHPNCRHSVKPVQEVSDLPQEVQKKAQNQAELGNKALATGKRNPKEV